jgi:hypothetical protein
MALAVVAQAEALAGWRGKRGGDPTAAILILCGLAVAVSAAAGVWVSRSSTTTARASTLIVLANEGAVTSSGSGAYLSIDWRGGFALSCTGGSEWERRGPTLGPTSSGTLTLVELTLLRVEMAGVDWAGLQVAYGDTDDDTDYDRVTARVGAKSVSVSIGSASSPPAALRDLRAHLRRLYAEHEPAGCRNAGTSPQRY